MEYVKTDDTNNIHNINSIYSMAICSVVSMVLGGRVLLVNFHSATINFYGIVSR